MAVTESRVKTGTLTLDTVAFATQVTNIRITPGNSAEDPIEVLSGDTLGGGSSNEDVLNITAIQDFADAAGFVAFAWANRGTIVPFTWKPSATAAEWTGSVEVQAIEVGGDVNTRLTSDAEWKITELTPPTGFVPPVAPLASKSK